MTIDYKKLLPSNLRETRWGEFLEAIQAVMYTIKSEKIDIIEDQFNIDLMTDADIIKMRDYLGYTFLSFTDSGGYTESTRYLKRQILTIVPRILNRNNLKAYKYNFYIYDLIGNVYPMYYDSDNEILIPKDDWESFDETAEEVIDTLDIEGDNILYYDEALNPVYDIPATTGFDAQYLDTDSFPTLDMQAIVDKWTRHILIPFKFRYVENNDEFLSQETLSAFYEDILYTKRITELAYFEPILEINCEGTPQSGIVSNPTSGVVASTKEVFYSYDNTYSGIVNSFYYGGTTSGIYGFSGIAFVEFGNGAHDPIEYGINACESAVTLTGESSSLIPISDFSGIVSLDTPDIFHVRKLITQKCKLGQEYISELALKDANSGVVFYGTFPKINTLNTVNKYYNNIQLDIQLV
jgi:hypothetical protein